MKRLNLMGIVIVGQAVQMALMTSFAFAIAGDVGRAEAMWDARHASNTEARATRIEGTLAIKDGSITISDAKTGRRYRLTNADGAKKLFDEGARNVAVEGTFADADTIQVSSAEKN